MSEIKELVEAALFMSSQPMEIEKLKKITDGKREEVKNSLEEIRKELGEGHGVELFKSPEGYEFRVRPKYIDEVSHLTPHSDLSRGPLKVLALVAFRGPITQSNIAKIIGNRAYSYIKDLERRKLIRSEKHGRTKKLEITQEFKDYFGIEERKELEEKLENMLGGEGDVEDDVEEEMEDEDVEEDKKVEKDREKEGLEE
ncbi:MAG: SMC-Scp complex subunit ScpB [Candidatus Aenigmatarchaeota archaeon]